MSSPRRFVRALSVAAPALPEAPVIVFDDVCVLCAGFVQWVIRNDREKRFRFTAAQGALGQALYRDLGLDTTAFETNLVVIERTAYGKLAGFIEVATRLGGIWRAAAVLRLIPAPVGDWLYDRIARNRYALFGKRAGCWLPTTEIADRVI